MLLEYDNYNVIHKSRQLNKNGAGGVALMLKKEINYIQIVDKTFDELEILAINIFINNLQYTIISYYNAPHLNLNTSILTNLNKNFSHLIVLGDLNAKSTCFCCKSSNHNGSLLEDLIINSILLIVNYKDPTYYRISDNSADILDWCLISNNLNQQ